MVVKRTAKMLKATAMMLPITVMMLQITDSVPLSPVERVPHSLPGLAKGSRIILPPSPPDGK
jgi:hypothetical protein